MGSPEEVQNVDEDHVRHQATADHVPHHDHPHGDDHDHDHDHDHPHEHAHHSGVRGWLDAVFHLHGHGHAQAALVTDANFMGNEEGIRTVWLALAALTFTSVLQVVIVLISGSVALLADTLHNIGDGLNSIPLLIAFYLARRVATRRYTYGFGRAEDVAGIFIVLSIAVSAAIVFWESFQKLLNPEPLSNLGWVAVAAVVGFIGNEAVAWLQIRKGREIGSAALVADGLHARTDGLTSLAVLIAVVGSWLGFPIVDPHHWLCDRDCHPLHYQRHGRHHVVSADGCHRTRVPDTGRGGHDRAAGRQRITASPHALGGPPHPCRRLHRCRSGLVDACRVIASPNSCVTTSFTLCPIWPR